MKESQTAWAIKVWHPEEGPHFKTYYYDRRERRVTLYRTRAEARGALGVFDPRYFKSRGLPVPRVVKVQVTVEVI